MKPIQAFLYILFLLVLFLGAEYLISSTASQNQETFDPPISLQNDTILIDDSVVPDAIAPITTTIDSANDIEYPSGDTTILFPFFRMVDQIDHVGSAMHVIYFGDSQIENDRITSAIRDTLQDRFSGKGIGLLPIDNLYNISHHLTIEISDTWDIHSIGDQDKNSPIKSLLFKHSQINKLGNGWFKIKQITGNISPDDYNQVKLFYSGRDSSNMEIKISGNPIYTGVLNADSTIRAVKLSLGKTPESLELYFSTTGSLILSGISLESPSGIMVDNIPLRGFSFPPFENTDKQSIHEMLSLIEPSLFIFGFGVNVVPSPQDDYSFYTHMLTKQIRFIQEAFPKIPVLMVGVSDMSKKENGQMISYPNIATIKKAQYDAALECNCAFFDLERFMGGNDAMKRWVNSDPELGKKDFTHFTRKGADKVGKEIGSKILREFTKYKKNLH